MPRTRRARDKQIDGFRRVTRNMRGGNDIIGGSTVKGKDGKAISVGNTVSCSGLFGSKTFMVKSIDPAKKGAPPSLVNPGNYAAAKCTKVDLNAPVKDTKGFALSVNHDVTCKGLLGSSTFKIQRVDRATGKVFDAKNNGYVAATKCTYQAPGAAVTKKTNGKRSAIKVQIKEADIKTYKTDIERLTGSILLGYTKKDGSMPVQLGGNMNPDGTLEEEGGALKTLTTLSTYILIFKDTIIPTEFETAAAKDIILKSRINVDKQLTPVPSSYAQLISGPSSSGRETAVKIQIKPADLSKFKDDIEKAAGFKILGYTDKSGKNPVQLPQQLGGSLNPDGTFDEQGGALKTVTLLSTYIVIFNGAVNAIAFESKVAANATLKKIMNVDTKLTDIPASFMKLLSTPPPSNTPSNSGSSAPPEEQAAAVDAAASASTAAEAAEAVASTTNDPAIKAAAEAAAAKPGATPASVQKAVQAAAAATPAAVKLTLSEDTVVCRLPSGEAGVQPSWEPDQDYANPVSVLPAQVPSSMQVSVTGISEKHIQPTKTKIGTKTLYYTFVLIKGKVFGITALASSIGNAIELMQPKMNKESGVVKVRTVTSDIENIMATEAAEEIEHLIESFEGTIGTLLASPAADTATAAAIEQQVATHKKTIATLKATLAEYKKHAQSGGRRKSRRHYRKKARLSRKRRNMRG